MVLQRFKEAQFAGNLYEQAGAMHVPGRVLRRRRGLSTGPGDAPGRAAIWTLRCACHASSPKLYGDHGDLRHAYLEHREFLAHATRSVAGPARPRSCG